MKDILIEINDFINKLNNSNNLKKINNYFNSQLYTYAFVKQLAQLEKNIQSIDALIMVGNVEDGFTIFRKYLETLVTILSIIEHPEVADRYLFHDKLIGEKACGLRTEQIKEICNNKPFGYLEYGYLEPILNIPIDKYGIALVAKCANVPKYYRWYRISNNFVHNNLTSVNYNDTNGGEKLKEWISKSFHHFIEVTNKKILNS